MQKKKTIIFRTAEFILLLLVLVWYGNIRPNKALVPKGYCKGVDISHFQGTVDMQALAKQNVDFIYIKATEGTGFVDDHYADNDRNAEAAGILVGAYHFFNLKKDGKKQAEHFIETIGNQNGKLVPAVDIEYYGSLRKHPPEKAAVQESLQKCLNRLEEEYQRKPVIYTTLSFYGKYIKGNFNEYPLWIRNVYFPADLSAGRDWTFWQYDDKAVLKGYQGDEKYIDRNVFHGNLSELKESMVIQKEYQFTFEACSSEKLQAYGYGSAFRNLYTEADDKAEKHSLFIGQVIALFGEPASRTSDNEDLFSQAVAAKDSSGNVLYLEVYYGPSGPTVAGGGGKGDPDEEYQQKAVDELAEYIMSAEPADFAWESVYEDFGMTVKMGVKDGKPYYETELSEELEKVFKGE